LINWQQLTLNLRRHKPLSKIAIQADIDAGTLRRIARGDTPEPKFSQGIRLLDLHYDLFPDRHKEVLL